MKNLIIIASTLRTRYLRKKTIWGADIRSDIISLLTVCICSDFDGIHSLVSANAPLRAMLDFLNIFI